MLIKYETENVNVGKVTKVIFLPTDAKESDPNHIDLGDTPMIYPENIPGMDAVLKVNLIDKVLFYDYYAPETIETKVSKLQQENAELNLTIGNLVLESANDKATIASLEDTVGTLLFEVAALKGGAE